MPGPGSESGWVGEQGEGRGDRRRVFFKGETRKGDNIGNVIKENIQKKKKERALTALPGVLSSIPSNHMVAHNLL
jgi:hypothetical protein